jgi:hypothetical protein
VAVVDISQRGVFAHLDDPDPGISREDAEQLEAFGHTESLGVREVRRRQLLFPQDVDVKVKDDGRGLRDRPQDLARCLGGARTPQLGQRDGSRLGRLGS